MWAKISISIPDFEKLSDDELGYLVRQRDGKWSPTIRAAMRDLKASGLDLNSTWAETYQDWHCPACQRGKRDILRLTDTGILLARLEVHHDHLGDYIKRRLRKHFGPKWNSIAPAGAARAEEIAERLVVRFEWAVICADCNGADAAVKRSNKDIAADFSFTPAEIQRFVRPQANAPHSLDTKLALDIWEESKANFNARVEIADTLFEAICAGHLHAPWTRPETADAALYNPGAFAWSFADVETRALVSRLGRHLVSRSLCADGVNSKTPRKVKAAPIPPTDEEYAAYDGGGGPTLWQRVNDDWRCPACSRTKREILRPGKSSKKWVGRVHEYREYDLGTGPEDEPIVVQDHREILICSGCIEVLSELKRKYPEFKELDDLLSPDDLRSAISVAPHARHDVDWALCAALARKQIALRPLIAEYWKHREDALAIKRQYDAEVDFYRGDSQRALAALVASYNSRGGEEESEEIRDWLGFMLEEADRFSRPSG